MNKNLSFLVFLSIFFCAISSHSQHFKRIEHIAGFGNVSENNGVAVADYDNDLDLDIFIVAKAKESDSYKSVSRLFRNNNDGSFTDVTESSNLINLLTEDNPTDKSPGLDGFKYGAYWGDFNNDGYQDIFFTHASKVQLFKNNQDGTFTDITVSSGINISNTCFNTGATWFDFNKDGLLDIYIGVWGGCSSNSLYKNLGNETFQKVQVNQPQDSSGDPLLSFMMNPYDFNADGFLDMYVSTDHHEANLLFLNNTDESFTESASDYNLESNLNDMAVSYNDFDMDGDLDVFLSGIVKNNLFENNGANQYSEVANSYGVNHSGWTWGSTFADFDLDGDEDLFLANGFIFGREQNLFLENTISEGVKGFSPVTDENSVSGETSSIEALPFDFDNDGDLDLFVTNMYQQSFFYENLTITSENHPKNWVKIALEGTDSNKNGFGAIVKVETSSGVCVRNYSGVGFLGQSVQPLSFGLNENEIIETIEINWPSGNIDVYNTLEVNRYFLAVENQELKPIQFSPAEKVRGCTDPNSCNYDPLATEDDGSCYYMPKYDISGDTEAYFNSEKVYSYPIESGSAAIWNVEGGEILEGQGTSQITIKWGLGDSGVVTVQEIGTVCSGEVTRLEVALQVMNLDLNYSVARIWNEALLEAIRRDYARPNVHARNLHHTAIAMYDVFAIFDEQAKPFLIGNITQGFTGDFNDEAFIGGSKTDLEEALSYAVYRLLTHRFKNSPGAEESWHLFDAIMNQFEYDTAYSNTSYQTGSPAALGNFVAEKIIEYGYSDGANEHNDYHYSYYEPVNEPLSLFGNETATNISNPNRWQPLTFGTFIDQSGNLIDASTPEFLGPEWGNVTPFSLSESDRSVFKRGNDTYQVYHDPGMPPQLLENSDENEHYMWNFSLVSIWSSHLDPSDGVVWDISPKAIGNYDSSLFSPDYKDLPNFYKELIGGDYSIGHTVNPKTQMPYETQMVPRADYARVLAEFWADGPDSETPPGHWFTILNYVHDHPDFRRKFKGEGEELDPLEWDVKAYFILAGAMHDAAISAWGIKGWYDYIRPISAIRYMAELGQSSDQDLPNYHPLGIPLKEGYIELVDENDPLKGSNSEHIGKVKLFAWKGHRFIQDAKTDLAGVDWILAEEWWPYQRPSFVTPPFAGYVSGHSTFSRAAAEVLTLLTGDPFFPGGMGEFVAKKNEFLVFEKGPSVDVVLQWATYRDASDQTSLSRIWGGIHPPADDIVGRLIGEKVGIDAFNFALPYFESSIDKEAGPAEIVAYPNPVTEYKFDVTGEVNPAEIELYDLLGKPVSIEIEPNGNSLQVNLPLKQPSGLYILKAGNTSKILIVK